jgi:carbonic anhydrase
VTQQTTPAQAWDQMRQGNARFSGGVPTHPRQDAQRRAELHDKQEPHAVVLCCSDSRLAPVTVFDEGVGDLFVVRNAGHVVTEAVIASVEYGVELLATPLVVVLGHEKCGAVAAAIASTAPDAAPLPPHIGHLIESILPAVRTVRQAHPESAAPDAAEVGAEHVRNTISALVDGSEIISAAVAAGTLAIVGAEYRLREGTVSSHTVVGSLDDAR